GLGSQGRRAGAPPGAEQPGVDVRAGPRGEEGREGGRPLVPQGSRAEFRPRRGQPQTPEGTSATGRASTPTLVFSEPSVLPPGSRLAWTGSCNALGQRPLRRRSWLARGLQPSGL